MGEKIASARPAVDRCVELLKTHPTLVDLNAVSQMGKGCVVIPCITGAWQTCEGCSSETFLRQIFSRATDQELEDMERYIKITVARRIYEGFPDKPDFDAEILRWPTGPVYLAVLKKDHFYLNLNQVNCVYSYIYEVQSNQEEKISLFNKCYEMLRDTKLAGYPTHHQKVRILMENHTSAHGFSTYVTTCAMLEKQTLADLRILHRYMIAITSDNKVEETDARTRYLQLQAEHRKNLSPVTLGETQTPSPPPPPTIPPSVPPIAPKGTQGDQNAQGSIPKDTAGSTSSESTTTETIGAISPLDSHSKKEELVDRCMCFVRAQESYDLSASIRILMNRHPMRHTYAPQASLFLMFRNQTVDQLQHLWDYMTNQEKRIWCEKAYLATDITPPTFNDTTSTTTNVTCGKEIKTATPTTTNPVTPLETTHEATPPIHPLEALRDQVICERQEFYSLHMQQVQTHILKELPFQDECNYKCEKLIADFLKQALAPKFIVKSNGEDKVKIEMIAAIDPEAEVSSFLGSQKLLDFYKKVVKLRDEAHLSALQYQQIQIAVILPNQDAYTTEIIANHRREYLRKAFEPWFQVTVNGKHITIRLKERGVPPL